MMIRPKLTAIFLSVALLAPSATAFAEERAPRTVSITQAEVVRPDGSAIDRRGPILLPAASAPRPSPFAPTPKPIVSEGAKAGLVAGAIVVGALIVAGVIVIHH